MFIFRFSMNLEVSEPVSFLSYWILLLCEKRTVSQTVLSLNNETCHTENFLPFPFVPLFRSPSLTFISQHLNLLAPVHCPLVWLFCWGLFLVFFPTCCFWLLWPTSAFTKQSQQISTTHFQHWEWHWSQNSATSLRETPWIHPVTQFKEVRLL